MKEMLKGAFFVLILSDMVISRHNSDSVGIAWWCDTVKMSLWPKRWAYCKPTAGLIENIKGGHIRVLDSKLSQKYAFL
jgi:hypothetical protein